MKYITAFVVWLLVGVGALLAWLTFPLNVFAGETAQAQNKLRAIDKAASTWFGYTGKYTLSAELGRGTSLAEVIGRVLVDYALFFGAPHCREAAKREGLVA